MFKDSDFFFVCLFWNDLFALNFIFLFFFGGGAVTWDIINSLWNVPVMDSTEEELSGEML